jgi:multiple sugar transport system permease protein
MYRGLGGSLGRTRSLRGLTLAGLAVFLLVVLVPFWWIATMSFKTYAQIQFATSIYVPDPFTWENYTGLWTETPFPLWFRNSLVTALVVTTVTTIIASLSGYTVARLRFPGREAVASLILILYLVPPALLFIPLYRVLAELGTTNRLTSLFLSYPTFTVPFCTWLLIGFFKALPHGVQTSALTAARPASPGPYHASPSGSRRDSEEKVIISSSSPLCGGRGGRGPGQALPAVRRDSRKTA